jgi:L-ascorbate metabolism protein UlaG (beta-lactamase superfamily)
MGMIERSQRVGKRFLNPVPSTVGGFSLFFTVLWRFLTNREERIPKQKLGPFRTDARVYENGPASGLRVTWMGHSSSLLEIDGARILIDPVWEKRAAPVEWFGPHRFFAPPLALDDLPSIDIVIVSHDHFDHLGSNTVRHLSSLKAAANAQWLTPLEVGPLLKTFGVNASRITELDWKDSIRVGELEITALPARHFSGRTLTARFKTLWASFAIAGPKHRVYYGADSGEWEGFSEVARDYGPFDLTMLEIGAFDPLWSDIHMGPDGAIRTFRAMGNNGALMPIHWGLFNLALHAWRQPIERMFAEDNLRLWSPEPGTPTEVLGREEVRSEWWR